MSLQIVTVADSISKLSVTGVTIKDLDGIPEEVSVRDCPVLFPNPDGFITNARVIRRSAGSATDASKDVYYTLNYIFLYSPVGQGRGLFQVFPQLVTKAAAIMDTIISNDTITGLVDITPRINGEIGVVEDTAGSKFFGCMFAFDVVEFVN